MQILIFKDNPRIPDRLLQLSYTVNIPSHNVLSAFTIKPASHSANKQSKQTY